MLDVLTVDAASTIMLLMAIEAMYPGKRLIHLFVDNARYHHAKLVQAWLARPGCRIRLRFIPAYCPHLDPIERLWGLAHKHITHNRCYESAPLRAIAIGAGFEIRFEDRLKHQLGSSLYRPVPYSWNPERPLTVASRLRDHHPSPTPRSPRLAV